ncbi:class I SAM-dependent methyltransferase [Elusimicrobiota bacterium]
MKNKEFYKDYFESIYRSSNKLSECNYGDTNKFYELNYKKFLPGDKNAKILDIGCGVGDFLFYLKKEGYKNIHGIDISQQQIEYCRKNISQDAENVDAIEYLREKKDEFDLIVANDLIEHISKNVIVEFIGLVREALKENGTVIMKTGNCGNPFGIRVRYVDFTHSVGFTEKSLYQVFWMGEFRNIEIIPNILPKGRIRAKIINYILKKMFWYQGFVAPEIMSHLLIAVAKKQTTDA